MQASLSSNSSHATRDARRQRIAWISLLAAALVASIALVMSDGIATSFAAKVIPIHTTVAFVVLVSAIALAAIEIRRPWLAAVFVAPIAVAIGLTIAAWVFTFAPPFGLTIFAESSAPDWFPTRDAIEAAMPTALVSLVVLALTIDRLLPTVAPIAWATGFLLVITPPLRNAAFAVWTPVDINEAASQRVLTMSALMLLGIALMFSRRVHADAMTPIVRGGIRDDTMRGARLRAVLAVIAIATTVVLWYAVRATEVRQLRSDVDFALETVARELQDGLEENVASADRLWQHWYAQHWQVSDALFLNDTTIFLQRQIAIAAVAMLDKDGRIMRVARRQLPFGSEQSSDDVIELSRTIPPLADDAARSALLRTAAAKKDRARGAPFISDNGVTFTTALMPIIDGSGTLVGALWLMHRPELSIAHLLKDTAPDFHVRLLRGEQLMLDRAPHDGVYAQEQRFLRSQTREFFGLKYTLDIAPNEKIVRRALSWTPQLVLLFSWASLFLLIFALYNERRLNALFRDRERILNQSLDLICTLRADGRVVTANDAAQSLLGIDAKSLQGRSLVEFVPPNHREAMRIEWLAHASETQTAPTSFIRTDGREIFLQAVSRWSEQEQLLYCAIRDVTAEHESQIERQHAENTFRIGVVEAGCAVYEYQPHSQGKQGRIEWVGAIRTLTGYEPDELSAGGFEGWMRLIHPDDVAHVRQILERCIETQQPHTVDYRLQRKDGTYVPVLDRGRHMQETGFDSPRMIGALIDLTAIRHQETALRRSEERYRIIASQVGAVILERETATGRVRAFGPVEQIFGYTAEQLESRPLTRDDTMIHPEDRAHYFAAVDKAEQELSSYYVEHRRRHRGGHYIYIGARGIVLPGPDGRAEREIIAVTDITDRKRAELALQESEERFRFAIEQSNQVIYEYALNAELRSESRRFAGAIEAMLGFTSQEMHELYTEKNYTLIHPDDLIIVRNLLRTAMNGNGTFTAEHRIRHKDGHYVHVETRGALRYNDRGQIAGILGIMLDISAAKSAETDRRQYTAQLRSLAEIAHRVSTFLSLHELLKYLTNSMRELLGTNAAAAIVADQTLSPEDVIAVSYAEHYGPQHSMPQSLASKELHDEVRNSNTPRRYTALQMADDPILAQLTQRDELRHPLRGWLGAPLIGRDGVNLGLLEVSDKKEGDFSESDLQVLNQLAGLASVAIENIRLYATLEERVTARTRELEISNRELEAFSYSVSHDLRAPLRAIAGFSTILETEYTKQLDASARRYLQRISAGVERMANLIDDLLSLARVSRAELKREAIDLTALSKTILKRQTERLNGRKIEIVVDSKMRVIADPRLIEVALENLIENALKFSGTRDSARVQIGQRRIDGRWVFYVADNGVGFDPKYATNLFGVFQRLHSASDFPGTGVGLATVQRIVQRHHGRIWAEADVDRGATFYFTFTNEA